jgi:hypothetical protein
MRAAVVIRAVARRTPNVPVFCDKSLTIGFSVLEGRETAALVIVSGIATLTKLGGRCR